MQVKELISGKIPAIFINHPYKAKISGDFPVNWHKFDEIQRFGLNKRKNFPYFLKNKGHFQFKRNYSGYFFEMWNLQSAKTEPYLKIPSCSKKKDTPQLESVISLFIPQALQMLSLLPVLFFAGLRLCVLLRGIIPQIVMAAGILLRSPFHGSMLQRIQDSIVWLLHS